MRPENNPIEGRAPVQDRIADPGLSVTASPVTSHARSSYEDTQLNILTQNLNNFTGESEKFAAVNQKQVIESEQRKSLMASIHAAGAKPTFTGAESQWYQKERMKYFAQDQTAQALIEANKQMEALKADPEALSKTDPTAFATKFVNGQLGNIDDPTVGDVVYRTMQSHLPGMVQQISVAKREQAKVNLQAAADQRLNSAYQLAMGTFSDPAAANPATGWQTFDTLVGMGISEQQAMGVMVQATDNAMATGRNLHAPDWLNSKNPRNGWSAAQFMGSDPAGHERINKLLNSSRTEIARQETEAATLAKTEANEARRLEMDAVEMRVLSGENIPQNVWGSLDNTEKLHFQKMLVTRDTDKSVTDQSTNLIMTVGADNVKYDEGKKVDLQRAMEAQFHTWMRAAGPFDPKQPAPVIKAFERIVDLQANGSNSSLSIDVAKDSLSGSELMLAPDANSNTVQPKVQLSLAVYKKWIQDPSLSANLDKVMSKETQEFNRIVMEKEGTDGLVSAVQYAHQTLTPENLQARQSALANGLQQEVFKEVNHQLENPGMFSWMDATKNFTADARATISRGLPAFLTAQGLTVTDPEKLAKLYVEKVNKEFIAVPDPQTGIGSGGSFSPASIYGGIIGSVAPGAGETIRAAGAAFGTISQKNRMFPRVDPVRLANFAQTQKIDMPIPFQEKGYPQAILIVEKALNEQLNADNSVDRGRYTLAPDDRNPLQLKILKDGVPTSLAPVPVPRVWNTYTAVSQGGTFNIPRVAMKSRTELAQSIKADLEAKYETLQQGAENSRKAVGQTIPDLPPMEAPKGKKQMPDGYALPPMPAELTGKVKGKAGAPRSSQWLNSGLELPMPLPPASVMKAGNGAPRVPMPEGPPPLPPPLPRGRLKKG